MQLVTGTHAIEEMLKSALPKGTILYILKSSSKVKYFETLLASNDNVIIKKVASDLLDKLSISHHGAVLAINDKAKIVKRAENTTVAEFCDTYSGKDNLCVLILDSITDPHNIGAILRSADCFKIDLVVIPKVRSASINETVYRVSSGAASYVPVAQSVNLVRDMELLKDNGFWIYACDMGNKSINDTQYSKRCCFVLGREGEGLHASVKSKCDYVVSIPIFGHIDSLNVSVAAGIIMCDYRIKNPLK